jgi:hypothetical protein
MFAGFRNFLQQVSTSLRLDGLEGDCYIPGAKVVSSTTEPQQQSDDGPQYEGVDAQTALNRAGQNILEVKGTFRCALYGSIGNPKSLIDRLETTQSQ